MAGIDPLQMRLAVIRPALTAIRLGGDAAEELLLGTALQESADGRYLHQLGGPALGPDEMEPVTYADLWARVVPKCPGLAVALHGLMVAAPSLSGAQQMQGNLYYAAAMCRVKYLSVPDALPAAGDLATQAAYYKRWYNTPLGAATEAQYIANWRAAFPA